jgi:hypothetical protein
MSQTREEFATQIDSEVLATMRQLAGIEGRQLQALVDEAFSDLIEKRNNAAPRDRVMEAYHSSRAKYASRYKKLAA